MVVDPGRNEELIVLLIEHSRSTSHNLIVVLGSRLASKIFLEAWAEEVSLGIFGHTWKS